MKIAISATNPCHLYDLALQWHAMGVLGAYHSGYPGWRLHPSAGFPLRSHSARTVATYVALRLPRWMRPEDGVLFRWQDDGFDRATATALRRTDGELIHAMPGQALRTFQAARRLGIETCLNHASGPLARQHAILSELAANTGVAPPRPPHPAELERRAAEMSLADWHCAASGIVRDQLIADGVPLERIWVAPYAADPGRFFPPDTPRRPGRRLLFAGQITPRKGLFVLAAALRELRAMHDLTLDCYGPVGTAPDLAALSGDARIRIHGTVSQAELGRRMRQADLLVLPSWEEAFGLVVPQALQCGLPVIVSDRVGAADIVTPRKTGSVFPAGDSKALANAIAWWLDNPGAFEQPASGWDAPARALLAQIQNRPGGNPACNR